MSNENVPHVYTAINEVTAKLASEGISKDNQNLQQKYKFRGIDDVYNTLSRMLSDSGLVIIPYVLSRVTDIRTTGAGTSNERSVNYTFVDVEYKLVSSKDGSSVTARTQGEASDYADKSTNKAMSAAYKYMAFQVFCIPTEGDNDADKSTIVLDPPSNKPNPEPVNPVSNSDAEMAGGLWFKDSLRGTKLQLSEFQNECKKSGFNWGKALLEAQSVGITTIDGLMKWIKEGLETK